MPTNEQNVIIKGLNGNWATTSFGPRLTNKTSPSARPRSMVTRQLVLQLDGDVKDTHVPDFANETLWALVAGCFVTNVYVFSETGATVALTVEDEAGGLAPLAPPAAPANGWGVLRDADVNVSEISQLGFTIGVGETAHVVVEFLQAEPNQDGGVLHRNQETQLDTI